MLRYATERHVGASTVAYSAYLQAHFRSSYKFADDAPCDSSIRRRVLLFLYSKSIYEKGVFRFAHVLG